MENESPKIKEELCQHIPIELIEGKLKNITSESIFEVIRGISDPEHPYSLEQLSIVSLADITVYEQYGDVVCSSGQPLKTISVVFTPTIPHCSMSGIIGLCIMHQVMNFTENYVISVKVKEGSHVSAQALNKQLADKDRVFAAFENEDLLNIIQSCIHPVEGVV